MQDQKTTADYNGGGFVGAVLAVVIAGLGWALLTPIAMEQPWLALAPLIAMIVLSVAGLVALDWFPAKRWRVLGTVIFVVACADLYLVNAWWDVIPAMWMGLPAGADSIRPLMVNCVLIAFVGIGALLSLQQQRPPGKPAGGAQETAAQADPKPGLLP